MQYEPIKRSLGKLISGSVCMRKILFILLDILLLRTWHVKRELRKIGREINDNSHILDAGSGLGQYTWRMSRMNKSWMIDGVDLDEEQVKDCKTFFKKEERIQFRTADLAEFRNPGRYDLILSVDVMEHIREDERVFTNFCESLKQGGYLLISTPSDKGGSDAHDTDDESFIDEHVRNGYSVSEITEKLTRAGFRNVEARYTYGKPGNISWQLSMKYPVKMLNISYLFFIILPIYYLFCFPVSLILNIFDLNLSHRTGTGLLIIARK